MFSNIHFANEIKAPKVRGHFAKDYPMLT